MKAYDFDKITDRRGTNCLKYDFAEERGYPKDVLPLWVADMDFPTAPPILEALHKAVDHGIFGYSQSKTDYFDAVAGWFRKHFNWELKSEWLLKTPGVVFALSMAVRAFTNPDESILIQTPVYYPFYSVIKDNNRKIVTNELICVNGHYEIDFDDFEEKIKTEHVKLFILCSPHNPVGRVWTVDELRKIGDICKKYDVIIVSDEIHCDFVFPERSHIIFNQACPELADRTVICTSPSKTFNLAGLQLSNIWIKDPKLRRRLKKEIVSCGYTEFNTLGLVAAKKAYESGEDWHQKNWEYIQENLAFLRRFVESELPGVRLIEPEGTYFAWLDFAGLGLDKKQLNDLIIHKAGLWLDAGHIFGEKSALYQRIVLACPRSILEQALKKIKAAIG